MEKFYVSDNKIVFDEDVEREIIICYYMCYPSLGIIVLKFQFQGDVHFDDINTSDTSNIYNIKFNPDKVYPVLYSVALYR